MPNIESINLRINKFFRKNFANKRRKKINKREISIISNNCWGGMIYESYYLEKQSPTAGLFFNPTDYLKFISKFKYYLSQDLKFIEHDTSKNKNLLKECKISNDTPIAILDDVEIIFLHYKEKEIAKEKWNRRIKRINYENIIFKFNDQNGCTEENLETFLKLPYKNKIFFTVKKWKFRDNSIIKIPQLLNKKYIWASHEPFGANIFFNVNKYINNIKKETYFEK